MKSNQFIRASRRVAGMSAGGAPQSIQVAQRTPYVNVILIASIAPGASATGSFAVDEEADFEVGYLSHTLSNAAALGDFTENTRSVPPNLTVQLSTQDTRQFSNLPFALPAVFGPGGAVPFPLMSRWLLRRLTTVSVTLQNNTAAVTYAAIRLHFIGEKVFRS